jgi:hypothetical protein
LRFHAGGPHCAMNASALYPFLTVVFVDAWFWHGRDLFAIAATPLSPNNVHGTVQDTYPLVCPPISPRYTNRYTACSLLAVRYCRCLQSAQSHACITNVCCLSPWQLVYSQQLAGTAQQYVGATACSQLKFKNHYEHARCVVHWKTTSTVGSRLQNRHSAGAFQTVYNSCIQH